MKKDLLHFAHGNGFPSPCYRQLFQSLQVQFECCYIDRIGHDVNFPVSEHWDHLVSEVIYSVQCQATAPVIAVGHSLGGVLSLLAAIQQPTLFKAVILLDSPLINRLKSNIVRWSKVIGMIDHITPASRTRKRRTHWPTHADARAYLHNKRLFRHFAPQCLDDYIEYGLQQDASGYSLRFDSEIEYQIYRTLPHRLYQYEGQLRTPTALIYGQDSNVIDKQDVQYMRKRYGIVAHEIAGTHMFPLEHPEMTAALVIEVVEKLLKL